MKFSIRTEQKVKVRKALEKFCKGVKIKSKGLAIGAFVERPDEFLLTVKMPMENSAISRVTGASLQQIMKEIDRDIKVKTIE